MRVLAYGKWRILPQVKIMHLEFHRLFALGIQFEKVQRLISVNSVIIPNRFFFSFPRLVILIHTLQLIISVVKIKRRFHRFLSGSLLNATGVNRQVTRLSRFPSFKENARALVAEPLPFNVF